MEFLPLAFCDSVCAVLQNKATVKELHHLSSIWNTAGRRNARNRVCVTFILSENMWSYRIANQVERISYADLKKLNRRHLRVEKVVLTDYGFGGGAASSLREIKEIAKFTASFVNMSLFAFTAETNSNFQEFAEILPFYKTASFGKLSLKWIPTWMNDFLKCQLESGIVQELTVLLTGYESDHLRVLEEFLLTKQFRCASTFRSSQFSHAFFRQLLGKPLVGSSSSITANVTCGSDDFRSLCQERQIRTVDFFGTWRVSWKRKDGVVVTVNKSPLTGAELQIDFEKR